MRGIDQSTEIYRFIEGYTKKYQRPPTLREIMQGVGLSSTSVVSRQLQLMEEQGTITRDPFTARGIRLR